MTCKEREAVSALLDNELQGEERERITTHIEHCGDCSIFVREIQSLSEILGDAGERALRDSPTAPDPMANRTPLWRRRISVPIPVMANLLFALLLLAIFAFARPTRSGRAPVDTTAVEQSLPSTPDHSLAEFDPRKPAVIYVRPRVGKKEASQ